MDVLCDNLLAGSRFPADQDGGFRACDLLGPAYRRSHCGIAGDKRMCLAGSRFKDRGDQVGIGRQRQKLASAFPDGPRRRLRVSIGAAGDHGNIDALGRERAAERADAVRQIA